CEERRGALGSGAPLEVLDGGAELLMAGLPARDLRLVAARVRDRAVELLDLAGERLPDAEPEHEEHRDGAGGEQEDALARLARFEVEPDALARPGEEAAKDVADRHRGGVSFSKASAARNSIRPSTPVLTSRTSAFASPGTP